MRPHTSPEVLLGHKSGTKERVRRAGQTLLAWMGFKGVSSLRDPDALVLGEKRVSREARALATHIGGKALTQGVRLRAALPQEYRAIAEGKRDPQEHHLTHWSITVMGIQGGAASRFEIVQSDLSLSPESVGVAEGGRGHRLYGPDELTLPQTNELYTTVSTVLEDLLIHGNRAEPTHDGLNAQAS